MLGVLVGAAVATKMVGVISKAAKNYMQGVIFVSCTASSFRGADYLDVIHNLQGMGFTNININEIRHNRNFLTRNIYGKVESVSINGNSEFQKGDMFAQGAHVVVSFHVYKDSPRVEIPELYRRTEHLDRQLGYQQPVNVNVNIQNELPHYDNNPSVSNHSGEATTWYRCAYCGATIPNSKGFCPRCGAALGG